MPARGGTYQGMNWIWGPTRYAIYYRDRDPETGHFRCVWCASRVWVYGEKGRRRACLDHLHPVHLGGNHKQYNLVTSCIPCNNHHGGKHWEERDVTPEAIERVRADLPIPDGRRAVGGAQALEEAARQQEGVRLLPAELARRGVGFTA